MNSVEALWLIKFGDYESPNEAQNGGVIVFESGRCLGGDSGFAYVGNYTVTGNEFKASVKITRYNDAVGSVFGPDVTEAIVNVTLNRNDQAMLGQMTMDNNSDLILPIFLTRFSELP
jgi:hypothetical protein